MTMNQDTSLAIETEYAIGEEKKGQGPDWQNLKGDEHFQQQKQRADGASKQAAAKFYRMMQEIGDEMQEATNALSLSNGSRNELQILDLCMAPGGYTASALKYNPTAKAFGITLHPEQGGHQVLFNSPRSTVLYHDITMFATEFGVDQVPLTHPEHDSFSSETPFLNQRFDLASAMASRLTVSQLILALQRIRPGGTLIMLLHKIEAFDIVELLYIFSQISEIQAFKPAKKHAIRSSFYLIAKNIQPDSKAAKLAIVAWKKAWWNTTFAGEGAGALRKEIDEESVQNVINAFGDKLAALAGPVWKIHAEALSKTDFVH
ncbi:uncharacterized protein PAC_18200 [Phialocephala subalpina]|uniref:Ribosomal RNA methyltransferase FtsJ domain-containing protein n=1 Tax=Phialocephala subalpina TaxID=576137 RepID=A0A1L7XTD2_9HELO|nr:uncharacterized protein PAC_18200 [Phialocephala subalpina]